MPSPDIWVNWLFKFLKKWNEKNLIIFQIRRNFSVFFRHKTWNRHLCDKSSFWQPAILCSIKFWRPKQSGHTSPTRCSGPERQSSSDCCCCCCWRRCCCCCSYCNFAVIVVDVVVVDLPDVVAATAIAVVTSCCCCFWFWYSCCCYISCLFYQKSWNQDTFIF